MNRASLFGLALVSLAAPAAAQAPSFESQTTQALLVEVRQLRQDLQNAAATIQRVQIVMFRLQDQTAVLSRASDRLDAARARCSQAAVRRKMLNAQAEQAGAQPRAQGQADFLVQLRAEGEGLAVEEQECRANEVEAESQFRAEQARMTDLQDQLDKVLAAYAVK